MKVRLSIYQTDITLDLFHYSTQYLANSK